MPAPLSVVDDDDGDEPLRDIHEAEAFGDRRDEYETQAFDDSQAADPDDDYDYDYDLE